MRGPAHNDYQQQLNTIIDDFSAIALNESSKSSNNILSNHQWQLYYLIIQLSVRPSNDLNTWSIDPVSPYSHAADANISGLV